MNNHIPVCCYATSIEKSGNHVFTCSNIFEHVAKGLYFSGYAFMTVNNENKLLLHKSYLIQWAANCFTVANTAAYIKMIFYLETLH